MDSITYTKNAVRTESVPETINIHQAGLAVILQLADLTGKLVDQAKRKIFYGQNIDPEKGMQLATHIAVGASLLAQALEHDKDINTRLSAEEAAAIGADGFDLDNLNIRLLHSALGCFTESAELIESVYAQYQGKPLDMVNFGEEIGDIEWYQAIGFDESGVTEASCREKNIAKLRKRYPEKFDSEQAVNRDLDAERETLK